MTPAPRKHERRPKPPRAPSTRWCRREVTALTATGLAVVAGAAVTLWQLTIFPTAPLAFPAAAVTLWGAHHFRWQLRQRQIRKRREARKGWIR